jgi:hypothetical protein
LWSSMNAHPVQEEVEVDTSFVAIVVLQV